mgnify:CR=1 FL=1
MSKLDDLITQFERFPGVGTRQARRFAFHILTMPPTDTTELARLIEALPSEVVSCTSCHRFFSRNGNRSELCTICLSPTRDHARLLVVAHDADIQAIERSGVYDGLYFVLGGTVPLLSSENTKRLRGGALKATVETRLADGLTEVILGFAVNPDGENTARFVHTLLSPILSDTAATITHLGRGLSTGSELEYADPDTIRYALSHRTRET